MSEAIKPIHDLAKMEYLRGYIQALQDYGIWKSGIQVIGCLETPVKEIIEKKFQEQGMNLKDFVESENNGNL